MTTHREVHVCIGFYFENICVMVNKTCFLSKDPQSPVSVISQSSSGNASFFENQLDSIADSKFVYHFMGVRFTGRQDRVGKVGMIHSIRVILCFQTECSVFEIFSTTFTLDGLIGRHRTDHRFQPRDIVVFRRVYRFWSNLQYMPYGNLSLKN